MPVKHYGVFDAQTGEPRALFPVDIYPDIVVYGDRPEPTEDDPNPAPPEVSRARNPAIPAGAVALTEAQWREFVDNPGERRWDGAAVAAYAPPPPLVDLAAYISNGHKALRDGGVTIGDTRVATDAESRGLIDGAYALSQALPDGTIDFKASTGWVSVDSQTMQTIALAVGRWVQLCYSAYRRLDEARAAGTVTTTAQADAAYAAVKLPG